MTYREKFKKSMSPIAKQFGITVDQAVDLFDAMQDTWSAIAADYMDAFRWTGDNPSDVFKDDAEMIAEATLDADHILMYGKGYNGERDLSWVYRLPDGSWRHGLLEMGGAILRVDTIF